jgi:hypothetical protein
MECLTATPNSIASHFEMVVYHAQVVVWVTRGHEGPVNFLDTVMKSSFHG